MAAKGKELQQGAATSALALATLATLSENQGAGLERVGMEDVLLPRVTILQDLSPQTKRRNPEFVEGAEPGKIFNVATQQVLDLLQVLPCAYIRHHIEWKPNRGGLVRDHGDDASIMRRVRGQNEAHFDVLDNGNLIVPTGTWYCLDLETGRQVIIPMARTQMKPSRKWMSLATSEMIDDPANSRQFPAPLFYRAYTLTTVERSDDTNSWFVWAVERGPTILELAERYPDLLQRALAFQKLVSSGEVRASASDFEGEGQDGSGAGGAEQRGGGDTY